MSITIGNLLRNWDEGRLAMQLPIEELPSDPQYEYENGCMCFLGGMMDDDTRDVASMNGYTIRETWDYIGGMEELGIDINTLTALQRKHDAVLADPNKGRAEEFNAYTAESGMGIAHIRWSQWDDAE